MLEYIYTNRVGMLTTLNQDANTNEIPDLQSAIAGTVSSSGIGGTTDTPSLPNSPGFFDLDRQPYRHNTNLDDNSTGIDPPDNLTHDIECVLQLIMVANEYLLLDLQQACEFVFSNLYHKYPCMISMDNIARLTNICDICKATHLRQACLRFIQENFDAIRNDDDLRLEISHTPELALLFVDAISQSTNSNTNNTNSNSNNRAIGMNKAKRMRLSSDRRSVSENNGYLETTE